MTLQSNAEITKFSNFINGQFLPPANGKYINSFNPSTDEIWAHVPDSDQRDAAAAVDAAKAAFPAWSSTPVRLRAACLNRIADLIEARLEELAMAESRDQGKPLSVARSVDIPRAVHNFRFFASAAQHNVQHATEQEEQGALSYVHASGVGVAVLISPWNLPLYLLTFKIAPALAAGNAVVCKPSELTSATAFLLARICLDAQLPAGVLNIVFGTGPRVGEPLITHPDTALISFTGSTRVGYRIRELVANSCKRVSLELGGKNAGIVFDDADLNQCLPGSIRSSYWNQGEVCLATSRLYVQRTIYDQFVKRFVELARAMTVGDPMASNTNVGALVSREHLAKVRSYVQLARDEHLQVLCGEGVSGDELSLSSNVSKGYFIRPTVIVGALNDSRLMQEEIFGPVVCIVPFDSEDEAIHRANNVKYGLSATLWTGSVQRAHRVSHCLQAGTVWVNCWLVRDLHMPFGGMKESGIGREDAVESLRFFSDIKTVCIKFAS